MVITPYTTKVRAKSMARDMIVTRARRRGITMVYAEIEQLIPLILSMAVSGYSEARQINQLNRVLDSIEFWNKAHGIA